MRITGVFGRHFDGPVLVDGEPLDPRPSQRVFNHSPDGFSWGYSGSGPAQLALALLLHECPDEELAVHLHQDFKDAFVAPLPQGDFELEVDVHEWIFEQPRTYELPGVRRRMELILGGPARPFPLTVDEADLLVAALSDYMPAMRQVNRENPPEDERDAQADSERLAQAHDLKQRLYEHAGFRRRPARVK